VDGAGGTLEGDEPNCDLPVDGLFFFEPQKSVEIIPPITRMIAPGMISSQFAEWIVTGTSEESEKLTRVRHCSITEVLQAT